MTSAFVKQNESLKVGSQSQVLLNVNFENNSKKKESVELVFFNSSYPLNTWKYEFTLAPKSYSSRNFPFKLDAGCKELRIQLKQGNRILKQMNMKVFLKDSQNVLILDNILKEAYLKASFFKFTNRNVVAIDKVPADWSFLKNIDLIIINNPSPSQLNPEALKVISRYVNNGGSILFNNPATMDKVFQYGYGHLLPVNYLFNKKVNKSKVILRKSTSIINSDKPFDFMEAELKKGSYELLRDQSGLLVAGKAVGSGLSFFYALPFDQTVMAAHANQMQEFLSFFIGMSRRVLMPSDHMGSDLERYMTGMSGMRAPDSKGLFLMLVIYGSVVFIIFLIARFTGKTQGSWVLVGAIALIMSSYIALTKDSMINVPNENKELSMIYKPAVDLSVNEKVYALYQHAKGKIPYKNDSAGNYIVNLSTGQKALDLSSSIGFNMVNNGPKKTEVNIENLSVNFLKLTNKSNKQSLEETEIDAETWRNFAVWSETNSTSKSIPIKIGPQGLSDEVLNYDLILGRGGAVGKDSDDFSENILKPLFDKMGRNQLHLIKNEFLENGQSEITNFPVSLIVSKGPIRVPNVLVGPIFTDLQALRDVNGLSYNKTSTGGRFRFGFRLAIPIELHKLHVKKIEVEIDLNSDFPSQFQLVEGKKRTSFKGNKLEYKLNRAKSVTDLYFDLEIIFEDKSKIQTVKQFSLKDFKISLEGEIK